MTFKTTRLRDAVVLALVTGMTGGAGSAFAQDATPASEESSATTLDAITVTGSRITTPGLTTNSPVLSVEREEFMQAQPVSVEDFVKQLPSVVPSMGPGMNNGTSGAATIDLRGLGPNRTLVLVDGRRPVPFDLFGVVDTNTIPLALLQSVDVLTGGASTVYGADAIAGVANFILRRDFEGVEISSSYGQSKHGDGARQKTDITIGANSHDGRGNVVMNFGYTKTDPVRQGDRPWGEASRSSSSGAAVGSGTTVPSLIIGPPGVWGAVDPSTGVRSGVGQIDPATGEIVDSIQTYNFNPVNYYQTSLDRYQITALGRFEINRHAEVYGQANYTRSQVDSTLAPSGLFLEAVDIPIGNPFIPEPARQQLCAAYDIAAADCVAGNTTLVENLTVGRRLTELGPRLNSFDTKTFQVTAGMRGDISDNWRYDAFWSHGESEQLQVRDNWGSFSKTLQALLAVDPNECLNPSNGCVPLDIWGAEGSITPEMVGFFNLDSFSLQKVEQENAGLNVSGDLGGFQSPWSDYPIGIAAGYEHRRTTASTRSDAASQVLGEVMGTGAPTPDRHGGFRLQEVYAEVIVPLVSGLPGINSLSLEAGYRRSDFKTSAGTSDEYGSHKIGLEWTPVDSLRFRGMIQRANRAPNINELFAPVVTGLGNLDTDPCGGGAINQAEANTPGTLSNLCRLTGVPVANIGALPQPSAGQVNTLGGGNPLLTRETADSETIGLIWTPSGSLAVTLDYWKIEMEDMISFPSELDVLNGCYSQELNPNREFNAFCELIGRSPITGTFNGSSSPGIFQQTTNQGRLKRDGFDLGIRYGLDLADAWGRLDFALDATRYTSNDFQATPASVNRDCLGYYSTSCTPNSEFKSSFRTTWNVNDMALSLAWRHTSRLEVEPDTGNWFEDYREIPAYNYFDLSAKYRTPFNTEISLSVNNLADKKPPIVGNTIGSTSENSGNTYPQFYDSIGRYYTLGVTVNF
ncbi:TonB-dependent receptor [Luteimonas sp. SJ-92]|uniref:TonB-dependent receptor n=1 Tax=Luteimonas salinisoli TaxID=2752307 RepID=A0A853JBP6_9GAMM|nr:TonB-dependent receptor [Luteimonas salinisoli]NZA26676.1 TonB-dependent receptor [Luteimonas salinisoli]